MKIIKKALKESLITEAAEADAAAEGGVIVDPNQSQVKIQQEITDGIEDTLAADGKSAEREVDDKAVAEVASEIADLGADISADQAVVVTDVEESYSGNNVITRALDRALRVARGNKGLDRHTDIRNVLITGLPGSGKTSIFSAWCRKNGLQAVFVDAKNPDLYAYLHGYTIRDAEDSRFVGQAVSKNVADLNSPKGAILWLDELNRQPDPGVMGSLLTLVGSHTINYLDEETNETKQVFFKNFLFTVAAVNPEVPGETGVYPLTRAMSSRLHWKVDYDSNIEGAMDYFKGNWDAQIKALDPKDPDYAKKLEQLLREQDFALFILSHDAFSFSDRDDTVELYTHKKDAVEQRMLTSIITSLHYSDLPDVDEFEDQLSSGMLDLLEKDKDMFLEIIADYRKQRPTFEELRAAKGITLPGETKDELDAKVAAASKNQDDQLDAEEDEEFFGVVDQLNQDKKGGFTISPDAARAAITAELGNWN